MNDIEKIFYDDVREKKNIGKNIRYRKNRVYSDTVLFPYDLLSKKQKEKLNGVIKVSNIYDDLTYQGLKKLESKDRLVALNYLIEKFEGKNQLANHWGIKVQCIHDMLSRLKKTKDLNGHKKLKGIKITDEVYRPQIENEQKSSIIIDSKFTMQLIGEMKGEEFQERITNIASIIMKDKNYQVTFSLKEIE